MNIDRPIGFDEYIGQDEIKKTVKVMIDSAKKRNAQLDHLLFYGPPGLGKTSIANIIGTEMGSNVVYSSGVTIEKPGDLVSIIMSLDEGDILFIDEMHRMKINIEEVLYSAMEDFVLDVVIDSQKSVRLNLPKFTLIGATTKIGNISNPLRDRFGCVMKLEPYTEEQLSKIIENNALKMGMKCDKGAVLALARSSRKTPRIAIRLLKRVRDYVVVSESKKLSLAIADEALLNMGINQDGFSAMDCKLMKYIGDTFNGGPVGLDTLSATMGEDRTTIEDYCEPYLLQEGMIVKTPKGRELTEKGLLYIKELE